MSLALTRLQNFIYEQAQRLSAQENRSSNTPILDLFIRDSPNLLDTSVLERVQGSANRVRQIPVLNDPRNTAITIGTSVTCTVPDVLNTSAFYNVTYTPYTFAVTQTVAEFENNYISSDADFANKMRAGIDLLKKAIENQCIAALNNNRNTVWNANTLGPYTQTADALRVPLSGHEFAFNNFTPIVAANDFNPNGVNVAANYGTWPTIMRYMNQGTGNATNTAFQFGNFNFQFTPRIATGLSSIGAGFFMPQGTVAVTSWLPTQYTSAEVAQYNSEDKEWGAVTLPDFNPPGFAGGTVPFRLGYYRTISCADKSGAYPSGINDPAQSATPVVAWQFVVYVATIVAYNSDPATRVSPIFRFELNNS